MARTTNDPGAARAPLTPAAGGHTLTVRKLLPASRDEVFAAWTDAESMSAWMAPMPGGMARCSLDVRVGGSYRIDMVAGDAKYEHTGKYLVVDRPRKLSFTWVSAGTNHTESVVTIELSERGRQTELVLTHDRLPTAESVTPHSDGWTAILEKLGQRLAR
jgi:uncharacterized protein YndB with AHSA1/START domain